MQWLAAAALGVAASTPQATQNVHMSGLSFQLPSAWTVRAGPYALVASLAPTFDPNAMPWVTANLCDDSPGHPCPPGELDLSKDKQCSTIQRSVHKWAGGIKETRWVCPLLTDKPGARYSSSVTLFQVGKKKVFMTYLATEHDTPPTEFLDEVGKGMRPE